LRLSDLENLDAAIFAKQRNPAGFSVQMARLTPFQSFVYLRQILDLNDT